MRYSLRLIGALAVIVLLGAGFAASAGAYGGGATHDTWQIGLSYNCNNLSLCGGDNGGFWGWAEFDRDSQGAITGDGEFAFCFHSGPGYGAHAAGGGHASVDITSAHIGPALPGDAGYPGGQTFYVDSNVVNGVTNDPDFLGDSGIPVAPGHYSEHPAPGISGNVQVAYRAAR